MKKILAFNPAISSLNLGDEIIAESGIKYIRNVIGDAYLVSVSTHLPLRNSYIKMCQDADYKFVIGTNLLKSGMLFGFRQWDISWNNIKNIKPVILLGCGWWQYQSKVDMYSKNLWKKLLDPEMIHSVRDEYTKQKCFEMGITNVVNTACPTMWKFSKDFCELILTEKADNVVTTITDYAKDPIKDKILINSLCNNYKKVFIWPQGYNDYEYIKSLIKNDSKIEIIAPSLKKYDEILQNIDIEYVGTRLHGGIRALQNQKRALIIGIDNRAEELHKDFNLPVFPRNNINELEKYLYQDRKTEIHIPEENIERFLSQFVDSL